MNETTVDGNGNSQSELREMKNVLSELELLLLNGNKTLPYLRESLRRNSASPSAWSTAVSLSLLRRKSTLLRCSLPLARCWRGPLTSENDAPAVIATHPSKLNLLQLERGVFVDELPSAFLKEKCSELELSGLHSMVSTTLFAHPGELVNAETKYVFFYSLKPRFLEQVIEYKKMVSSIQSASNDLQMTLGLLAP